MPSRNGSNGTIGPDLTTLGGAPFDCGGTDADDAKTTSPTSSSMDQHLKPGNKMPPFSIFSDSELRALTAYLAALK